MEKLKTVPLKKTILSLFILSVFFFACKKEDHILIEQLNQRIAQEACLPQFVNPDQRSYSCDSLIAVSYTSKHCALLPLNRKNYWIYEDSIFNDGILAKVQIDTLRFENVYRSPDGLIWWEPNVFIGFSEKLYSNDSAIFMAEPRPYSTLCTLDVKKEFSLFDGDSVRYLAHFEGDYAAAGRSVKMSDEIEVPAGKFSDYILFDKNARSFRRDQLYFKPGLGVIKYIQEKAPMGTPFVKLQQISTLIKFHIE